MKSMRDTRAIPQKQSVQTQKRKRSRWTRDDTELSILALPTTVWYALFCYLPMFGLVLAFKNYKISAGKSFVYSLFHSEWAGLDNFSFFLKSNQFATILRNTLLYNIVFIILGIVLPVGLAIMINNIYSKRKSKTYQTMMFLPHFMSWVVISYFVYAFLSPDRGLMNSILQGMGKDPVRWYSEAKYWPYILVFMQVWKTLGYNMVVYLASITGIDTSLYEAAVRIQDAAGPVHHPAVPEAHHHYDVHPQRGPYLLLRLWPVLSGHPWCARLFGQGCHNL